MRFWGHSGADLARLSAKMGPGFALSPNLISNLRTSGTIPNLFHLYSLSEILRLRLGSVFDVFGIDLDLFLRLQDEFHQHRTRLIETCPFGHNQTVSVPSLLGPKVAAKTTAPLWELILGWQQVSSLTLRDATWRDRRYRYGKLGTSDSNAAPGIPAGAFVQMRIMEPKEIHHLDRDAFYFVQYPRGYMVWVAAPPIEQPVLQRLEASALRKGSIDPGQNHRICGIATDPGLSEVPSFSGIEASAASHRSLGSSFSTKFIRHGAAATRDQVKRDRVGQREA
jgi:hypothetical protein